MKRILASIAVIGLVTTPVMATAAASKTATTAAKSKANAKAAKPAAKPHKMVAKAKTAK